MGGSQKSCVLFLRFLHQFLRKLELLKNTYFTGLKFKSLTTGFLNRFIIFGLLAELLMIEI